jgi:hypothetical protein
VLGTAFEHDVDPGQPPRDRARGAWRRPGGNVVSMRSAAA